MSEVSLSLSLLYEDALVGALQVSSHEGEPRFSFTYSGAWRSTPHAFSLSLALPLREAPYGHQASRAYFENLLPEGEVITQLKRYASLKVSETF